MTEDKIAVRDAATMIVMRDRKTAPRVLMGQRGSNAVFMPNKFVFPGGAVDAEDADVPLAQIINKTCFSRLADMSDPALTHSICVAAIRELYEETGQILGVKGTWEGPVPGDWNLFYQAGFLPDASGMQYVFRAITPPGRTRRFDARFFFVDADLLQSDLDDFSAASEELSHLQWIPLDQVRKYDLPFITEIVLAEIGARVNDNKPPASVPFFKNDDEDNAFLRLRGYERPL